MRVRTFLTLLAVTIVVTAGAAISIFARQPPAAAPGVGEAFFPDLMARSGEIASIVVTRGGEKTTVALTPDGWGVAERSNYPADLEKIRRAITSLAAFTRKEAKTTRAENFDKLGVADPAPGSAGVQVEVLDAKGAPIASLLVGAPATAGGAATFVRTPGDSQVWLASGEIAVPAEPQDWLKRDIIDVEDANVLEIRLHFPDGTTTTAVRPTSDDERFNILEVPSGARLKSDNFGGTMAYAFSVLEFADVKPRGEVAFPKEKTQTIEVRTRSGVTYFLELIDADGDAWVRGRAQAAPDNAEGLAEAAAFNAETEKWTYRIPDWKIQSLRRKPKDLVLPAS